MRSRTRRDGEQGINSQQLYEPWGTADRRFCSGDFISRNLGAHSSPQQCAEAQRVPNTINCQEHRGLWIQCADPRRQELTILAGHGRCEGAKSLGMTHVPVVFLGHLTEVQAQAYMLADNKLTDRSSWDDAKLAVQLRELSNLALDFDIETTGFEAPEIDFRIQSL